MTHAHKPDELADFPIVIQWPVQWGDQDAYQHVNNTIYFRWFESARIAYLEKIGLAEMIEREGIGPILAAIECHFRIPLTYPDTVYIGAKVTRLGRSSMTMVHRCASKRLARVAADGDSTVVVFDYRANKSIPVPDPIRAAIEKLEGHTF